MKIHQVIGNVTLSRCHPSFHSARLVATEPLDGLLQEATAAEPDLVIVWDELGAGQGARVAVSDGAEAAQPFRPELKAVDAYCSAILDEIHIDAEVVSKINFLK